ncbi:phosphatidate cytidylyltransferase [Haemophilus influenzae 22.4-21]|uniref:Phosphatidate cytidylyltransferase n=1 Tax=Haemophilus influenzae 22.4-21 TaxID=375063 RepID=A4P020_HAEIF|nr:phosphatidate cytidylyltransferase [Haemophilus influenzae 22.4-21]
MFEQHLQLLLINAVSWWGLALLLVISYPKSAKFWSKNPLLQLFICLFYVDSICRRCITFTFRTLYP